MPLDGPTPATAGAVTHFIPTRFSKSARAAFPKENTDFPVIIAVAITTDKTCFVISTSKARGQTECFPDVGGASVFERMLEHYARVVEAKKGTSYG